MDARADDPGSQPSRGGQGWLPGRRPRADARRGPARRRRGHPHHRAWMITASTCRRVTLGNHSRKSSILAPDSMFSNKALTGTRVPRHPAKKRGQKLQPEGRGPVAVSASRPVVTHGPSAHSVMARCVLPLKLTCRSRLDIAASARRGQHAGRHGNRGSTSEGNTGRLPVLRRLVRVLPCHGPMHVPSDPAGVGGAASERSRHGRGRHGGARRDCEMK